MKNWVKGFNKLINVSILTSAVLLVIGIFLFIQPDTVIRMISVVLGLLFLVPAITSLVDYFKEKNNSSLVIGIITILISLILIINTEFVASILPFILGIYFVVNGINRLMYAVELKKQGFVDFSKSLVLALLIIFVGIIFIINPFKGALAITKIIGIFMIIYSVLDIINTVIVKKGIKDIEKSMKLAVIEGEAKEK